MNRKLPLRTFLRLCVFFASALGVMAQTNWTLRNQSGPGDLLWSVTDGGAGLVAVGNNGKILHSADGHTWETASSGTHLWLVAAAYEIINTSWSAKKARS